MRMFLFMRRAKGTLNLRRFTNEPESFKHIASSKEVAIKFRCKRTLKILYTSLFHIHFHYLSI